jgi:hypothetical protein
VVAPSAAAPAPPKAALERVSARASILLAGYEPPGFEEVPGPDAALFLTAIDHRTGYRRAHRVDGLGPYEGSALLWALGLAAERRRPGILGARSLAEVTDAEVAELLAIDGEAIAGPTERALLWRDLAAGLLGRYRGEAAELIAASEGRLAGPGGALARLAEFEAFSDPLRKKSFLVCKVWERRRWLEVGDPESWEVCADNVLMRLALRAGLVSPGGVEEVRAATREAWKRVAADVGVAPPILDDLLWERGRDDPDLLGVEGGDILEPPRAPRVHFY